MCLCGLSGTFNFTFYLRGGDLYMLCAGGRDSDRAARMLMIG